MKKAGAAAVAVAAQVLAQVFRWQPAAKPPAIHVHRHERLMFTHPLHHPLFSSFSFWPPPSRHRHRLLTCRSGPTTTGERHLQLHWREHRAVLCVALLATWMAPRAAAAAAITVARWVYPMLLPSVAHLLPVTVLLGYLNIELNCVSR